MWWWCLILFPVLIALLAFGLWLDQGGADRIRDWYEFNRKCREAHRSVMNYSKGINPTGARWNGAMRYNKKGLNSCSCSNR